LIHRTAPGVSDRARDVFETLQLRRRHTVGRLWKGGGAAEGTTDLDPHEALKLAECDRSESGRPDACHWSPRRVVLTRLTRKRQHAPVRDRPLHDATILGEVGSEAKSRVVGMFDDR
jgi:hypothetical protein